MPISVKQLQILTSFEYSVLGVSGVFKTVYWHENRVSYEYGGMIVECQKAVYNNRKLIDPQKQ